MFVFTFNHQKIVHDFHKKKIIYTVNQLETTEN